MSFDRVFNPVQDAIRAHRGLFTWRATNFCWTCQKTKPSKGGRCPRLGQEGPKRFTCADCLKEKAK